MNYKIDLHTHSILSYDGGITREEYINAITTETLDYIAITDHNEIDFAISLAKELPKNIIVGEEIMTKSGEIIGLFLNKIIPKKLTLERTIALIKEQNGFVYLPHPFDIMRFGIGQKNVMLYLKEIDLIEVFNARAKIDIFNKKANKFAQNNNAVGVAGTDAHIGITLGKAYNEIEVELNHENFLECMKGAKRTENYAPTFREKFAPTINVIKRKIHILRRDGKK